MSILSDTAIQSELGTYSIRLYDMDVLRFQLIRIVAGYCRLTFAFNNLGKKNK